ncbi:ribonuclease H-like domain-containing protein, partial [Tanacetum coccineum]
SEPKSYGEASKDIRWVEVMNQKMEAFNRNGTITDLPIGRKPIRIQHSWSVFQHDINSAFLYGDLVEDAYMCLPEGYFDKTDKLVKSLDGLKQTPRK